jgi:hypothetical protein
MTLVEVSTRDQHATSIVVQLFAVREEEKEFTLLMEIHKQKYEIVEAKLDTLFSLVAKLLNVPWSLLNPLPISQFLL